MDRDLTPEGQRLLDTILSYNAILEGELQLQDQDGPPNNVNRKGRWQLECERLRLEITKMIVNSLMVIEDCNEILAQITTAEGYINSDAKVAKSLNYNNIERCKRILEGQTAFQSERDQYLLENLARYLSHK